MLLTCRNKGDSMLYPRVNRFRQLIDLCGFWDFRPDPREEGNAAGWAMGFDDGAPLAVPASWNDQMAGLRDFLGPAWYSTTFELPESWDKGQLLLRFDSVNYQAVVWLNGTYLGDHEGGHLPFSFDVTSAVQPGENLIVLRVDGRLAPDRVPPGNVPANPLDGFPNNPPYPAASFDFFPFCGIHRPVRLCRVPLLGIEAIEVETALEKTVAAVTVRVRSGVGRGTEVRIQLQKDGQSASAEADISRGSAEITIPVSRPALWSPASPNLYRLEVQLLRGSDMFDLYTLPVGIRTIEVQGDRLLLNGTPILLKGFGRHEDFPVTGRGIVPAVIVRDFDIMKWTGANSFRTTHYPYSEEMMDLADRLGFLVVDEIPAVGLFFAEEGLQRRKALCASYIRDLVERDRNHPCVIVWSIANEPHSRRAAAVPFFKELVDFARSLDRTRLVTVVSHVGLEEETFSFCDILCLNRYYGWYTEGGRIEEGCAKLSAELDALHQKFGKPLLLTEFGADTVCGWHSEPPEMFSEEYQVRFIERYIEVLCSRPWVVGQHVWNLCDFKTGQSIQRVGGMNLKGVFTRDRRPKMAAHALRRLWRAR
jgi:beta-glucuronidase